MPHLVRHIVAKHEGAVDSRPAGDLFHPVKKEVRDGTVPLGRNQGVPQSRAGQTERLGLTFAQDS